jgi:hypothetical protein
MTAMDAAHIFAVSDRADFEQAIGSLSDVQKEGNFEICYCLLIIAE